VDFPLRIDFIAECNALGYDWVTVSERIGFRQVKFYIFDIYNIDFSHHPDTDQTDLKRLTIVSTMAKHTLTIRLSAAQYRTLEHLEKKLSIDKTNVIRLALTRIAEAEGFLSIPGRDITPHRIEKTAPISGRG
jgi:hypothetical protein